jgi:hypothetical protein
MTAGPRPATWPPPAPAGATQARLADRTSRARPRQLCERSRHAALQQTTPLGSSTQDPETRSQGSVVIARSLARHPPFEGSVSVEPGRDPDAGTA